MKKYKTLQIITALIAIVAGMFLDNEGFVFTIAWAVAFVNIVASVVFGILSMEDKL